MRRLSRKNRRQLLTERERHLITYRQPKSPVSEQYRTLRTNIEFSSIDEEIRTIMVTSASPGEGKSTTVSNLAVVFAQQGKRVLLIDSDLRKPTAHYTFQVTNTRGLTNVLTRQLPFVDAVESTSIEQLDLLTSGPVPPNPSELIGSRMMKQLITEALDEYDIVLFDCPPLLPVTDAQILSQYCQGAILVVNSGRTEIEEAQQAVENLTNAHAKLLGVVLNGKKVKDSGNYYYYGS